MTCKIHELSILNKKEKPPQSRSGLVLKLIQDKLEYIV
jgi:hypothetical protein